MNKKLKEGWENEISELNKKLILQEKVTIGDTCYEWWSIPDCYYSKVFEYKEGNKIILDVEAESFFSGLKAVQKALYKI